MPITESIRTGKIMANIQTPKGPFQEQINQFRKKGFIGSVKIMGVNDKDVCDCCKEIIGKEFTLDNCPELPYKKCTSKHGCRCYIQPIVSVDLAGDITRKILYSSNK
jgi:hypothetical protein